MLCLCLPQCPRFLAINGQNPGVSKSIRLYVVIFRISFIKLGYILQIHLKLMAIFLNLNFGHLFLKLNWIICNQRSVLPAHCFCQHQDELVSLSALRLLPQLRDGISLTVVKGSIIIRAYDHFVVLLRHWNKRYL